MTRLQPLIACLILLVQGYLGLGFGPRAVCSDGDGSWRLDSATSPCCCVAHHTSGPACCEPEHQECGDEGSESQLGGGSGKMGCGCVHSPIANEFVAMGRVPGGGEQEPWARPPAELAPIPAAFEGSSLALPAAGTSAFVVDPEPPPPDALAHLSSVILRL